MPRNARLGTALLLSTGMAMIEPGIAQGAPRQRAAGERPAPAVLAEWKGFRRALAALWARSGCLIDPHGCPAGNPGELTVGETPEKPQVDPK